MEKQKLDTDDFDCTLFRTEEQNCPLVVFNGFDSDGDELVRLLSDQKVPAFNLLNIRVDDWNHNLSPWGCPSLYHSEPPFDGGADVFLSVIESKIIPKALDRINGKTSYLAISGYSLAGLFALYSLYRTATFDRAASMSGSLWFPDFAEFTAVNSFKRKPDRIYLSLGDKESSAKNQYLRTVQEKTEAVFEVYKKQNIDCVFESNPGNHFFEPERRCAKGIAWILKH